MICTPDIAGVIWNRLVVNSYRVWTCGSSMSESFFNRGLPPEKGNDKKQGTQLMTARSATGNALQDCGQV